MRMNVHEFKFSRKNILEKMSFILGATSLMPIVEVSYINYSLFSIILPFFGIMLFINQLFDGNRQVKKSPLIILVAFF